MANIDQIVSVSVSQSTTAVSQASFSIPLIIGPTNPGWVTTDYVHVYSSPAGMLTDGFTTSSPEYIYALAMYAQPITPTTFMVGKRGAITAQVDTLSINTLTTGHVYTVTINGTAYSYTSTGGDTQQSILTALRTAIIATAPVTGVVSGTGSGATLTLTGTVPGQLLTYTAIDTQTTRVATTPATGIATDLANVLAQNPTWYGFCLASGTDADIAQAAVWIEGNKKLYLAVSSTAAIATSVTTDIASTLKTAGYKRTALIYSVNGVNQGIDAAWLGTSLAQTPGAIDWAFTQLPGISADTLSATAQSILIGTPVAGVAGKNANIYQTVGGVNVTEMGTTASGQFIDITVGLDWLQTTLQANIYSTLVNNAKVPFTDQGVSMLISAVKAAIDQGVTNGLIDGTTKISISAPAVASVSTNQRAQRIAPTITFQCRLQGAFNAVIVNGTVTV